MRRLVVLAALAASGSYAQQHEIGLTLGSIRPSSHSTANGAISLDGGIGLQANYGYRLLFTPQLALFAEVHFLANGQREIRSANAAVTRDVATLFVTPGVRIKFAPRRRISPYLVAGAGYALYEQSLFRIDGLANEAPRFTHRGAAAFGAGADVPVWRWLGGRMEVRDFYSGLPSFNVTQPRGGQHNVVISGGFVLFLGGRER